MGWLRRTTESLVTLLNLSRLELPANKKDVATARALLEVPPEALAPHIPSLLGWLQDYNWPVAKPVSEALARCGTDLIEPVRQILNGKDNVWKYWTAHFLLSVDPDVRVALADDITRIINDPTEDEAAEEVPLVMMDVFILLTYSDEQS